jgi:GTP-binding protein EngB required for normal cell division
MADASADPIDATPDDTEGMLQRRMEAHVRPYLDLVDQLRAVGIEQDLPIPQIVVMGDQSSGKSSVLEAMSNVPFPRGKGLVTRCATELRMKRTAPSSAWHATVKLSWPKKQPLKAGVVTREGLSDVITELTEALLLARGAGGERATFESEHSIIIELHSPDVPDLTIIDLPGIVRTHTTGQSADVMDEVNGLLDKYLRQDRTIVLAVIPSNVDIATVDILERASKADPHGVRTIGVLTKPDLIDKGGEDEVVQVLQGLRKPLNLVRTHPARACRARAVYCSGQYDSLSLCITTSRDTTC